MRHAREVLDPPEPLEITDEIKLRIAGQLYLDHIQNRTPWDEKLTAGRLDALLGLERILLSTTLTPDAKISYMLTDYYNALYGYLLTQVNEDPTKYYERYVDPFGEDSFYEE